MRALVTCCTALTGCPFESCESQKIRSSQRFIFHLLIFSCFSFFIFDFFLFFHFRWVLRTSFEPQSVSHQFPVTDIPAPQSTVVQQFRHQFTAARILTT